MPPPHVVINTTVFIAPCSLLFIAENVFYAYKRTITNTKHQEFSFKGVLQVTKAEVFYCAFLYIWIYADIGGYPQRVSGVSATCCMSPRRVPTDTRNRFSGMVGASFRKAIVKGFGVPSVKFWEDFEWTSDLEYKNSFPGGKGSGFHRIQEKGSTTFFG